MVKIHFFWSKNVLFQSLKRFLFKYIHLGLITRDRFTLYGKNVVTVVLSLNTSFLRTQSFFTGIILPKFFLNRNLFWSLNFVGCKCFLSTIFF